LPDGRALHNKGMPKRVTFRNPDRLHDRPHQGRWDPKTCRPGCTDLGILNGWFRSASKVDKASDLFEE